MENAGLVADVKEMLREQLDYRELLYQIVRRDLLIRYKETIMGFGWAVFMPIVNTVLFSIVFTRVAPGAVNVHVPYPVYSYSGLLAWNGFASALRFSVASLTSNPNLVGKVYFPREVFPFSTVLVAAVDMAVGTIPLVILMAYYRIAPSWALLFLPVLVVVQLVFTAGVALFLAMANLFFRDVKYLFEVVVTMWMFATAVLYPVDQVGGWLGVALKLNPMTPIVVGYRAILFDGRLPDPWSLAAVAALSVVILAVGWITFHRSEYRFAENL